MAEDTGPQALAPSGQGEELALAEARDALVDAREALVSERERAADARDQAADERQGAADARQYAVAQHEDSNEQLRSILQRRAERLAELIAAADARDRAAELRDRAAETRDAAAAVRAQQQRHALELDEQDRARSSVDRVWAGEDRDAAAAVRADIRDMARNDPKDPPADR